MNQEAMSLLNSVSCFLKHKEKQPCLGESGEEGREEISRKACLSWNGGHKEAPSRGKLLPGLSHTCFSQPGPLPAPLLCLYSSGNPVPYTCLTPPHQSDAFTSHLSTQYQIYPLQQAFSLSSAVHTALTWLTSFYSVLTCLYPVFFSTV